MNVIGDNHTGELLQFLSNKNYSYWYYSFTKNPSEIGLKREDMIFLKDGYESKAPDGFVIGNEEIFGAIGCPLVMTASIHNNSDQNDQDQILDSEYIDLNNFPSRLSVLVGPNKQTDHLRMLSTIQKFQDFIITYKLGEHVKIQPFWTIENRFLYRIEKSRIIVAELFNDDIKIKIISFALKSGTHEDLPVLPRMIIIENLTKLTLEEIQIGILLGNADHNWNIARKNHPSRFEISDKIKALKEESKDIKKEKENLDINKAENKKKNLNLPFWSVLVDNDNYTNTNLDNINLYNLMEISGIEELKELFSKPIENIKQKIDDKIVNYSEITNEDGFPILNNVSFAIIGIPIDNLDSHEFTEVNINLIPASDRDDFNKIIQNLNEFGYLNSIKSNPDASDTLSYNFLQFLKNTYEEWINWWDLVPIEVSDKKIFGLIDSILTMMRCTIGKKALHTGTLYNPHDFASWRDNYWIQNAFLKAGRFQTTLKDLDFFFNAWRTDGFKNSYNIKSLHSENERLRKFPMEIPLYSSLMVRNHYKWLKDFSFLPKYYTMVKDAIDKSLYSNNNLFITKSDETRNRPSYSNDHDYYIDNLFVGLSGYDFGIKMAEILKNNKDFQSWSEKRNYILNGIINHLVLKEQFRFASGIDNNGIQDESLITNFIARPMLLNLDEILNPYVLKSLNITARHTIFNGLSLIWDIMKPTGTIRSHTKTTAIEGNTIGHYLHACSDLDVPFLNELIEIALDFTNSTGSLNKVHDLYNNKWGSEKQSIWDSSSLLEGLLHYLFGVVPFEDRIEFNPHLPQSVHSSKISELRIHDYMAIISCHKHGENFEKSFFLKDLSNQEMEKLGFPIPEIGIIKTNLPCRFSIYDSEIEENKTHRDKIKNYFSTTIKLFPRFIDSNTNNEDLALFNLENPILTSKDLWKMNFFTQHFEKINFGKYSLDLPAHKIRIEILKYLNQDGFSGLEITIRNHNNLPLFVGFNNELKNYQKISQNSTAHLAYIIGKIEHTHEHADHHHDNDDYPHIHGNNFTHDHNHEHDHDHDHEYNHDHEHEHNHDHDHEHNHDHDHEHNHDHDHEHNHDHDHEHNHDHDHEHNHDHNVTYPFRNIFDHQEPVKPYWKPHPLILNLEKTLLRGFPGSESNLIIICDNDSFSHAKEINSSFSILKKRFLEIESLDIENSEESSTKLLLDRVENSLNKGKCVILISKYPLDQIFPSTNYHEIVKSESLNPISTISIIQKIQPQFKNQSIFFVQNNGDYYKDTHKICEIFSTYLLPVRKKTNSM